MEKNISARWRFLTFRVAARVLPSRVGPGGFLRLANEFTEAGRFHEAKLCWRIVHRMAPADTRIFMRRVSAALEEGDTGEVDRAVQDSGDAGVSPQMFVRVAGLLARHGFLHGAGRVLGRLARMSGDNRHITQSPSIVSESIPKDIGALSAALMADQAQSSNTLLSLARLSFTFRDPATAAALYMQASQAVPLRALDRVAALHSLVRADPLSLRGCGAEVLRLMAELPENPDALAMLAKTALVAGELDVACDAMNAAMRARYGERGEELIGDCTAIMRILASLRGGDSKLPSMLLERTSPEAIGVPKIFICGFGWSGSGAVYDEIRAAPDLCEFEGAGLDEIINEDADTEVMFVQGSGGLGDLWLRALERRRISWHALWDTFILHVVGLSPIGYAQYKSSAAAGNHVRRYGGRYTAPFRRFFEDYAAMRKSPSPGALHACLLDATESLCAMLAGQSNARAVLFNNAVFGRNAAMLEIFRAYRAAIVYRDPRDVYVDRREKDLNHWRAPIQLATYYAQGLRRYVLYKRGRNGGTRNLREVPFEQFIEDDGFRSRVRAWLLRDLASPQGRSHFDPTVSRRNVGIYVGTLGAAEQAQLRGALDDCRTLDQLSAIAWSTND